MKTIRVFAFIGLLITLYYFVYYIYVGILNPIPAQGDSYSYHIPISETIINGTFLHPVNFRPLWYQPGSSEGINSLLMVLRIPLTLSNILPTIILFFSCWKLAIIFNLKRYFALLFAFSIVTLNAVVRWQNAVSADMWVGVFFVLTIILLENPKRNLVYFAKLGFIIGMLVGSKYSGMFFAFALIPFYIKKMLPLIKLKTLFGFLVPFSILGLFWYIRNYIFIQNPFFPTSFLGFKGESNYYSYVTMFDVLLLHPIDMINAAFGEYKIWILSIFVGFISLIYRFLIKKNYCIDIPNKLFIIGLINLIFFLVCLPTSSQTWIMVSSFRYSLPVFIPLILGIFILAAKYKKEEIIGYLAIANMVNILSMTYYPKLILIYFPLFLLMLYFFNKHHSKI